MCAIMLIADFRANKIDSGDEPNSNMRTRIETRLTEENAKFPASLIYQILIVIIQ